MPQTQSRARLVVIQQFYHQVLNSQPRLIEARYSRILGSNEQPYGPRTLTVGEDWTPLELGWMKDIPIGVLVITNEEGTFLERNPTEKERESSNSKILEVAFYQRLDPLTAALIILPRDCQPLTPLYPDRIRIRCRNGEGRYTIIVIPA